MLYLSKFSEREKGQAVRLTLSLLGYYLKPYLQLVGQLRFVVIVLVLLLSRLPSQPAAQLQHPLNPTHLPLHVKVN